MLSNKLKTVITGLLGAFLTAMCGNTSCSRCLVKVFFANVGLVATNAWLTLECWCTTAYTAAQLTSLRRGGDEQHLSPNAWS